jgi:tetratricopeptide (TPR) repeat protein
VAAADSSKASSHGNGPSYWSGRGKSTPADKAEESAKKALELDPGSCQGHFLRGLIFNKRGDMQEAIRQLKQALAINADDPDALYWLSLFYSVCGKESAARPLASRYLEVDPLTNFSFIVGWLDYAEGDLEAGLEPFRRTYAMAPDDIGARWVYSLPLAGTKRLEELSSIVGSLVADAPTHVLTLSALFLMLALQGDKEEALQAVTPELEAAAEWDEVLPWMLAGGYAMLDEREKAYHWLEHAISRDFINYRVKVEWKDFEV